MGLSGDSGTMASVTGGTREGGVSRFVGWLIAAPGELGGSIGAPDNAARFAPLPLLAVSTVLAWLSERTGFGTPERLHVAFAVAGVAALWSLAFARSTWPPRRPTGARYLTLWAGHTALAAVLVGLNPWFGIVAFTGYLQAEALPARLVRPGCVITALIMAAAQDVGYPFGRSAGGWLVYLVIAAVNAALVITFIEMNLRVNRQGTRREAIIAELNTSNADLSAALAENAGLHAQLVAQAREAGVQDERQRMAGEIHDTLAQGLIGIVTQLEAAEQARHLPAEWQRHVRQAQELARSGLVEARRSVHALRPEQLEGTDLVTALQCAARTLSQPTDVEVVGVPRRLADDVENALFRVAQEAMSNVGRHAAAEKVGVTVTFLDDVVLLDVRDDGCGWSGSGRPGGYGLQSMQERLARVGGHLEIETAPGEGTALSASVPT